MANSTQKITYPEIFQYVALTGDMMLYSPWQNEFAAESG
jgi:hypothetical protein